MLEESAAQLAALRQRAEYLLEQLAADRDPAPGAHSLNEDPPSQPDASAPSEQPADYPDPVSDEPPHIPVSQSSITQDQAPIQSSIPAGTVDDSDSEGEPWGQPPPHSQEFPQNAVLPPALSDQSRTPPTDAQANIDDTLYAETQQDAALSADSLSQNFPLQEAQSPQSRSLLDAPVTAVPPFDWNRVQVAPERTPADVQMIEEEIISLCDAIDHVREKRGENTGHALALLREAREIIAGEPYGIARAEYNIQQARQIIDRARFSRSRSRGIALRTAFTLILWLSGLGSLAAALYFYSLAINNSFDWISSATGWNTSHFRAILWTVSAGGIGGCLGTISFLFERMRLHEEFDRQYIVRSTVQPLMGIVLGLVSYALLSSLFNSLQASIIAHPVTAFLPAAIALPVGIWQVYVYALIFRFTRLFTFQRRRRW